MDESLREKLVPSLLVSLFFSLTLFVFGPAHLYFTNIEEFSSSFFELSPVFIALSASCALLTTMLLVFLRNSIYQKALSVMLVVSFLLWFQGNVLVWQYGELDGREIDWATGTLRGLIDGGIWISLLVAALVAARHICRFAKQVGIAFIAIQLASVSISAYTAPDAPHSSGESRVSVENISEFSPRRNVILLVLDSFQTDVFHEIINREPYYRDMFDGFTYYVDALAGFSKTYSTVPLILTGRYYENTVPIREFIKEAFLGDSLPKVLKTNGYRVDIVGNSEYLNKSIYVDETIASNYVELERTLGRSVSLKEAAFLVDLTMFRCLPHFLKKYVHNNYSWFVSNLSLTGIGGGLPAGPHRDAIEFMKRLAKNANADSESSTFKYIHLFPPHHPVIFNEHLEYVDVRFTRENYKLQAKGTLELVRSLMEALKRIDVYDDTLILIIADTGWGHKVNTAASGRSRGSEDEPWLDDFLKGRALPVFLVKPLGSRGMLKISAAPVSVGDISKTVISQLGIKAEIPGTSIFDINASDVRERRFLYHWGGGNVREGYMPTMREFVVSGFSWFDKSWRLGFRIYTPDGIRQSPPQDLQTGLKIRFGNDGNYLIYQGSGWSYPEEGVTRTDQKIASLMIPIVKTDSDVELEAIFEPFIIPGKVDRQRVEVVVNGKRIDNWECTALESARAGRGLSGRIVKRTATIPSYLTADPIMTITFLLPDAISPASFRGYRDRRMSSLAMHSITLSAPKAGSDT